MSAGARLKQRRKAADLSQQELAVMIGMSLPIVSRWERGTNIPSREAAARVDEALEAGGEILAAFGYAAIQPDALSELQAQVAELTARVDRMQAQFEAVTGAVADSPADQSELPARRSSAGGQ